MRTLNENENTVVTGGKFMVSVFFKDDAGTKIYKDYRDNLFDPTHKLGTNIDKSVPITRDQAETIRSTTRAYGSICNAAAAIGVAC
jgi:hypothetical protein